MDKTYQAGRGDSAKEMANARQGAAVRAAWAALGSGDGRSFLNGWHAGLRGRPVDLAIASDAGLEAVEAAICVEARRALESC